MQSHFHSAFFLNNRQRLKKLCAADVPIILTANGLLQRGGDSVYPFSQDANFWYLCGLNEPDLVLVIDEEGEYLIVPERSSSREAFDGQIDAVELSQRSGIEIVRTERAGWQRLSQRLKQVKQVATIAVPPRYSKRYGFYTNPAKTTLVSRLKTYNAALKFHDISYDLAVMRMIKQPEEVAALQAAIDITIESLHDVIQTSQQKSYGYEYKLEAALSESFRRLGATGHAFEPIVASGKRAVTLHEVSNNSPLEPDGLVVIDVGAEVEHYAADLTRTIGLKTVSARQRAVYNAVKTVQQEAFHLLKPGVLLREYEQKVEKLMGVQLRQLGLITTSHHQEVRHYYPHATSHFLGLNVHDVGDYNLPLQAGMVLTVEPGIYIPEEGIGVRIEDDVLITEQGIQILSDQLPRRLR